MNDERLTRGMDRYRPHGEVMALRVWKPEDHPMLQPTGEDNYMRLEGSSQVIAPGDWLVVGIDWEPIVGVSHRDFSARYVPLASRLPANEEGTRNG